MTFSIIQPEDVVLEYQEFFPEKALISYLNHEYEKCSHETSLHYTSQTLPLNNRILLGLSMIKSGNPRFGLHHLSVAFETSSGTLRALALLFIGIGFELVGLSKVASQVLRHQKFPDMRAISSEFDCQQVEEPIQNISTKSALPYVIPPLREKIVEVRKTFEELHRTLLEFRKVTMTKEKFSRFLDTIHSAIMKHIFARAPCTGFWLEDTFEFELLSRNCPEMLRICVFADPNKAVCSISQTCSPSYTLLEVIKMKVVISHYKFLDADFQSAFAELNWVLQIWSKFSEKYDLNEEELPESVIRSVALLSARAYIACGPLIVESAGLMKRISIILSLSKNISIPEEISNGRLDFYFLTLGVLHQRKAFKSMRQILPYKFQLERCALEEMIRNFILLINLIPNDDAIITKLYDEVLIAFISFGGLHIKVLWVFKFLRDFFTLEVNLHCCFTSDSLQTTSKFLLFQKDMKNILNEICRIRILIKKEEFDYDDSCQFLVPKGLLDFKNHRLYLYEPNSHFSVSEVSSQIKKSNEFINLWIESYKNYKGELPNEVYQFLKKINFC